MNRLALVWTATLTLIVIVPEWVVGRDMIERPSAVLPGSAPNGFSLLPTLYGDLKYVTHDFQSGDHDSFWIGQNMHMGLVDFGIHRFGIYYGTYLITGPVDDPTRKGSDLAPWLMNAVQYEYGVTWRTTLGSMDAVGEYGRRSFHPLRRQFADPATDILRVGVGRIGIPIGWGTFDALVRVRWSRLFAFWGSSIPDPRAEWTVQPAVEYRIIVGTVASTVDLVLFASGATDILLLRDGGIDFDGSGELGLSLDVETRPETPRRRLESYLNVYHSGDTEEIPDAVSPVTLLGWGVRMVVEW